MLTDLQRSILEYVRIERFHTTLQDYLKRTPVDEQDAINAINDMKNKNVVSVSSNIMNGCIGVTNYGWELMGW